jgi:acetyl-CoA C-acetyltransferase
MAAHARSVNQAAFVRYREAKAGSWGSRRRESFPVTNQEFGGEGEVVLVTAGRTPFGRLGGILQEYTAPQLGAMAIAESLDRTGTKLSFADIDYVFLGQVVTAGAGQIPSRQASILAMLPPTVPSITVNKVCASGLKAVDLAWQAIRLGRAKICLAGGQESMSNSPWGLPEMRFGRRLGLPSRPVEDLLVKDGLWCPFHDRHMALHASEVADEFGFSRKEQDEWACLSQERAGMAMKTGKLAAEVFPVTIHSGKSTLVIEADEGPRPDTTLLGLSQLPPVFDHLSPVTGKPGSVTAGNAPGLNDGAAVCLVAGRKEAEKRGWEPLAGILDYTEVAAAPKDIALTPGLAIKKLLDRNQLSLSQIDLLEINEAFAAVVLVSGQALLGMSREELQAKVNVNGGAIAYGHPIGASGARILMTLAFELKRRGGGLGIAAICSGAAQGDAVLIKV